MYLSSLPGQEWIKKDPSRTSGEIPPGQREQDFVLDVRFHPTHLQTVHNHANTFQSKTFVYKLNLKQTLK